MAFEMTGKISLDPPIELLLRLKGETFCDDVLQFQNIWKIVAGTHLPVFVVTWYS